MASLCFLWPFFFILAACASTNCYYPNGTRSEDTVTCWDSSGEPSGLCCKPDDVCFDSKICAHKFAKGSGQWLYYRGNCFDRGWRSSSCPDFCIGPDSDFQSRLTEVRQCRKDKSGKHWFCDDKTLAALSEYCDDPDNSFTVTGNMLVYATAGINTAASSTRSSAKVNPSLGGPPLPDVTSESAQTLATATISGQQSTFETASTALEPPATSAASGLDVTGSPTPAPPPSAPPGNESSLAIPIGVGVGVGGTALVAASLLGFCYLRKRRYDAPARAETPPPLHDELFAMDNRVPCLPRLFHETKTAEAPGDHEYPREVGGTTRFELA